MSNFTIQSMMNSVQQHDDHRTSIPVHNDDLSIDRERCKFVQVQHTSRIRSEWFPRMVTYLWGKNAFHSWEKRQIIQQFTMMHCALWKIMIPNFTLRASQVWNVSIDITIGNGSIRCHCFSKIKTRFRCAHFNFTRKTIRIWEK